MTKKPNSIPSTKEKNEFLKKLPIILAIISILVSLAEGFSTPVLMGWDSIMFSIFMGVIGGIIGLILVEKINEPLIGSIEYIVTGVIIYMFIGRFGEFSVILFIITAIITLYIKGSSIKNKKLITIPIITFALIFILLIAGGALYQINAENSITVGNLTENITYNGYGYYDGYITGDINVDSDFDYLCVNVDYYDSQNKIIRSDIGWNELNPESGNTYKISSWYFENTPPEKAKITVIDSEDSKTPLYSENITINAISGV